MGNFSLMRKHNDAVALEFKLCKSFEKVSKERNFKKRKNHRRCEIQEK